MFLYQRLGCCSCIMVFSFARIVFSPSVVAILASGHKVVLGKPTNVHHTSLEYTKPVPYLVRCLQQQLPQLVSVRPSGRFAFLAQLHWENVEYQQLRVHGGGGST